MSYKCSFVDEVLYGPEDVNELVGDLVGAGVAPFISKDSYNPSDLNSLTADMVISGVQLGGCIVSRVSDTVVSVAPGIIYFGNGLRLKVTEAHSITVPENEEVTIYARYIPSLGTGELAHTTLTITKDDYNIPLALISADGTIKDAREFAESKIATLGTNSVYVVPNDRINIYSSVSASPDWTGNYGTMVTWQGCEIDLSDINLNRFTYVLIDYVLPENYGSGESWQKLWSFKTDSEIHIPTNDSDYEVYIKRQFNKLLVYFHTTRTVIPAKDYINEVHRHAKETIEAINMKLI